MKEKIRKLITTYHDVPIQMKASLWFVLSTVLLKGISFITVPIFTRIMDTDQYGILVFIWHGAKFLQLSERSDLSRALIWAC